LASNEVRRNDGQIFCHPEQSEMDRSSVIPSEARDLQFQSHER